MGESRSEDVEDFRTSAGEEDLLSKLMLLALRRKGVGVGRWVTGVETSRRPDRGVFICTGDEGGSGVRAASLRVSLFRDSDSLRSGFVGRVGADGEFRSMSSRNRSLAVSDWRSVNDGSRNVGTQAHVFWNSSALVVFGG